MLNERLKNLRLAKGMTLQQVADAFGISAASVASWEKGKNQPDSRKLSKIAEFLGSSVEFLLNGAGESQLAHLESIETGVPFVAWPELIFKPNQSLSSDATERVTPLHTKPGPLSFATRYPASSDLNWTQGPVPAGAIIFIDPSKDLVADAIALVRIGKDRLELARVQLPAKPKGHYLQLITSGSSIVSPKDAILVGTVVEWRISGKL